MYRIHTITDTVRIDPKYFNMKVEDAIIMVLREKYERRIDPDLGVILCIWNPTEISEGVVIPSDGGSYHDVTFSVLAYLPEVNEVVEGDVSEIVEFGAFVRLGPMDGLIHLSQIANDFMSFDKKTPAFVGKESKKVLKKGDEVIAKISTVSLKSSIADTKIGLTMRPEGLGKKEWIGKERKKAIKKKKKR